MKVRFLAACVVLGLSGLGMGGCASVSGGDQAFDAIVGGQADTTPFKLSGPSQDVPDRYLPGGTRVRIIGYSEGWARVQTTDGQTGFVPGSSVKDVSQ